MLLFSRTRLGVGLALALLALAGGPLPSARAQAKFKRVTFKTGDGVELVGSFFAADAGKKKDACVLLLHAIDAKKGGGRNDAGWDRLAERLQKEGYAVLSFDFRGFGDSKTVDAAFWKYPHNNGPSGVKRRNPKVAPASLDHKDFTQGYYVNLVNDIIAARAYLDLKNDAKDVNVSSLIVIGAGEGATLGALWMYGESLRRRDKNPTPGFAPDLADAESKDLAGAVWLSISPRLGGQPMRSLTKWLSYAGGTAKVPMVFVYGQTDSAAENLSKASVKAIKAAAGRTKLEYTGDKGIKGTKLAGSNLLSKDLDTEKYVVVDYLGPVMEKRGAKAWAKKNYEDNQYWYSTGTSRVLAKKAKDELAQPFPLRFFPVP